MHMRAVHPDMDTHVTCRTIDSAALEEAKESMRRIKRELDIPEEVAKRPGILDDPVWWLELAMERLEEGYDPFDDQAGYLSVLRKLRDDAWDCQTGRIDAMYEDYQREVGEL